MKSLKTFAKKSIGLTVKLLIFALLASTPLLTSCANLRQTDLSIYSADYLVLPKGLKIRTKKGVYEVQVDGETWVSLKKYMELEKENKDLIAAIKHLLAKAGIQP
jgi:hypothetical protein